MEANALDASVVNLISKEYVVESENRIQEKVSNDEMMDVFIQQRKREFVQYMSIGMTDDNIWKIFGIEALVIASRPLLITLPLTVMFVGFVITASYLETIEFLVEAPILEILLFIVAIVGLIGLAYYLGGKKILNSDIAETLRNNILI